MKRGKNMISKMEHTAIIVSDMDRSIEFYSKTLGFNVRLRGNNPHRELAFLYLGTQPDMEIELIRDINPVGEYAECGIVNHLAFTVEDIFEAIRYYKEKGIDFTSTETKPTLEGGRMILFYGPDRELLQLVERVKSPHER